jgi:hypothetical protein
MVKSRRAASNSGELNVTDSGRRPSMYAPSLRKVATSTSMPDPCGPSTRTTPKETPTGTVLRPKRAITCSGVAPVATS